MSKQLPLRYHAPVKFVPFWPSLSLLSACAVISPADHEDRLDEDQDGYSLLEDCDDQDRSIQVPSWYQDLDGDGYGTEELVYACTQPLNTATNSTDCDDNNADISPDGVEICDGQDNDCNGAVDDDPADSSLRFRDLDGDGFGDPEVWIGLCDEALGWVEDNTDCDDTESTVHPEAQEICENGRDDNCNNDPSDCSLGGTWEASEADVSFVTDIDRDELASSFSWAGEWDDVPGEDLWVGVPGHHGPKANSGAAVLLGSGTSGLYTVVPESVPHAMGTGNGTRLGHTVFAFPDADGDGRSELLAQNPGNKSAVLVLSSTPPQDNELPVALEIRQSGSSDNFGETLTALPDWDGDQIDEIVIGIPRYDGETSGVGSGAIALMASDFWSSLELESDVYFEDTAHTIITGETNTDHFASSLDQAGDTNGDGIPELIAGAPEQNEEGVAHGAAYVLQPRWHLDGVFSADDITNPIYGNLAGDRFGYSVAGVGDTNGDGYDDLLIGAPEADQNGRKTGAALLYLGPLSETPDHFDHEARLTGILDKAGFGCQVSSAGDMNLDGLPDVAVSAPNADTEQHVDAGAVYVFLSPIEYNLDSDDADTIVVGNSDSQSLGHRLAGAGFYNDDDRPDLAIGALSATTPQSESGTKTGALLLFMGHGE